MAKCTQLISHDTQLYICDLVSGVEVHYGTLGGFLYDRDGRLFGATCQHVTDASTNKIIYIKTWDERLIRIGRTLHDEENSPTSDTVALDIDIFLIDKEYIPFCDTLLRDKDGSPLECGPYVGKIHDLYGKDVYFHRLKSIDVQKRVVGEAPQRRWSVIYSREENTDYHPFTDDKSQTGETFPAYITDSSQSQTLQVGSPEKAEGSFENTPRNKKKQLCRTHENLIPTGRVVSKKCHFDYKENLQLNIESQFLVETLPDVDFQPGDSGHFVSLQKRVGIHEIIGVLKGVVTVDSDNTEFVLCTFFPAGLKMLEEKYNRFFMLPKQRNSSGTVRRILNSSLKEDETQMQIYPGKQFVILMTPEDIKKPDFVLVDRIIKFVQWLGEGNYSLNIDILKKEFKVENSLRKQLFSRQDIQTGACITNDQICYSFVMIGSNSMYKYDFEESQKMFKKSCRILMKTQFPARLLCKLVHCTAWFLLWNKQHRKLGLLLTEAEPFIESVEVSGCFPALNIAYYRLNYALFYMNEYQLQETQDIDRKPVAYFGFERKRNFRQEAIDMAKKATELFERHEQNTKDNKNFAGIGWTLQTRLYLNCGEYFNTRNFPVTDDDLEKARHCLKQIKRFSDEFPELRVHYHLCQADLLYREGHFTKSLHTSNLCKKWSEKFCLQDELRKANCRIQHLSSIV